MRFWNSIQTCIVLRNKCWKFFFLIVGGDLKYVNKCYLWVVGLYAVFFSFCFVFYFLFWNNLRFTRSCKNDRALIYLHPTFPNEHLIQPQYIFKTRKLTWTLTKTAECTQISPVFTCTEFVGNFNFLKCLAFHVFLKCA